MRRQHGVLVVAATAAAIACASLSAQTGAAASVPASAAHASSQLVWTKQIAPGVTRYRYRYGPLVAATGQNLILVGPVTIERPAGDGYVTRVRPDLVDASGNAPPIEQVHMHHAVMLNLSRQDTTYPSLPQRFYGFAEEKTIGQFPAPYGYPVKATDVLGMNYMLHNETPSSREVWAQYDLDWVPAATPTAKHMRPARPLWIDVQNGKAYPVFDALQGQGRHGQLTYPDGVTPSPYAHGPRLNEWKVDRPGTLVAAAGHLHPGGLRVDLNVLRGKRRAHVFRSNAKYFDPNGPVSWDLAMTKTPLSWRVGLRKGDVLRVSTTYDTSRASWYESMGLMLAYIADGSSGPDPFKHRVYTTGAITHGHLAAANNHGGRPTGLPDPRKSPGGATIQNGIAIQDFTYLPGDLSASGAFARPPVVVRGGSLRFGNFDSSGSIFHTVTACRAPCTGSTGVSFPLANGRIRFDSGQLGFGPTGYTAAANRADWYTPSKLAPGTYTYFCRVHPFMRGAFRVLPAKP
jgi:plastocyanin